MLKLNPFKLAFEFADFGTVGIHCILDAIPLSIDLFDDDVGIAKSW
jgi:hypothetical protein